MVDFQIVRPPEIARDLGIKRATIYDNRWKERTGCPLRKYGSRLGVIKSEYIKWKLNFGVLING